MGFQKIRYGNIGYIYTLYTKRFGYICVHMPNRKRGFFLFFSPDRSLNHCTFYIGPDKGESIKARMRKDYVGHNWLNKLASSKAMPAFEKEVIIRGMEEINEQTERLFKEIQLYGRRYRHQYGQKRKTGKGGSKNGTES